MKKIDVERCLRAMELLDVEGEPVTPERLMLIERAIAAIQADGRAFHDGYFGIKNYAHFGDQDCDAHYWEGPKHGHIVFRVGRGREASREATLGPDHVYLLECVRDFGAPEIEGTERYSKPERWNLCQVLREWKRHKDSAEYLSGVLAEKTVETSDSNG